MIGCLKQILQSGFESSKSNRGVEGYRVTLDGTKIVFVSIQGDLGERGIPHSKLTVSPVKAVVDVPANLFKY